LLNPVLKYAGGKRWLIPTLKKYYKKEQRLIEPFAGGVSVALGLGVNDAVLNDLNPHVINLYKQIQHGLVCDIDMRNDKDLYYYYRDVFNDLDNQNTAYAAQLFYYLNRTCFNGLVRFNKRGDFNVGMGSYFNINYKKDFLAYKDVFSSFKFTCTDFSNVQPRDGDFVYIDPPYHNSFNGYTGKGFSWGDQVRLCKYASSIDGDVVVSNKADIDIIELYSGKGFEFVFFDVKRNIACKKTSRKDAKEVLIIRSDK